MTFESDGRALEALRLMDRWRHFPAYQLERRADIFFGTYLPEIVEHALGVKVTLACSRPPRKTHQRP